MFRRCGTALGLLAGLAAAEAVPAQEPPPPPPAPTTGTAAPGEALRTSFLPTVSLSVFTNGNTNVVGDEESAVGASVALSRLPTFAARAGRPPWPAAGASGEGAIGAGPVLGDC